MPAGYTGTVLARRDQAGQPEAAWQAEARFESVTYWNHDTHPAKMDSAQRCFEWLGLARAVCALDRSCDTQAPKFPNPKVRRHSGAQDLCLCKALSPKVRAGHWTSAGRAPGMRLHSERERGTTLGEAGIELCGYPILGDKRWKLSNFDRYLMLCMPHTL